MSYYDYQELFSKATSCNATQADINALGDWLSEFGMSYWNGEYFDCGDGYRLFPFYEVGDDGISISGYFFSFRVSR